MARWVIAPLLFLVGVSVQAQAQAQPRGAAVYSSFRDGAYWYRDEQVEVFRAAGWGMDAYENTRSADLIAALERYAVVVFGTGYNIEHAQDLAAPAAARKIT